MIYLGINKKFILGLKTAGAGDVDQQAVRAKDFKEEGLFVDGR